MRTPITITAALWLALPVLAADTAGAVQKALQASYDSRDKAVARRDISGTLAGYAPEFVGVSRTGRTHTLAEERADFAKTFALPAQTTTTQSAIEALTLAKSGTEAEVTLRRHGTLTLADPAARAVRTVVLDGVYRDTWAKKPGGWRLVREQVISTRAALDGKPL